MRTKDKRQDSDDITPNEASELRSRNNERPQQKKAGTQPAWEWKICVGLLVVGAAIVWKGNEAVAPQASSSSHVTAIAAPDPIATAMGPDKQLMNAGQWRDPKTGLIWMRCSQGQTWDGATCMGEPRRYTWLQAQQVVRDLNAAGGFGGNQDWRLPYLVDLRSLRYCMTGLKNTDGVRVAHSDAKTEGDCQGESRQKPTLSPMIFPNTPNRGYWSPTPVEGYDDVAGGVGFDYALDSQVLTNFALFVRLVRDR